MPQFSEQFSSTDWTFLSQMPATVGAWMIAQEPGGGPRARKLAQIALDVALNRAREKYARIPLIAELLSTDAGASGQHANAPQDCGVALRMLQTRADEVSVNCFRLLLVDIAEAVAKAAPNGEWKVRNLYNGPKRGWLGLYPLMANAVRMGRGPRVTRDEKKAINRLIAALGAAKLVQEWELDPFRELSQA